MASDLQMILETNMHLASGEVSSGWHFFEDHSPLLTKWTRRIHKRGAVSVEAQPIMFFPAGIAGADFGFLSGLTGVGGGVFLTPLIIAFGWAPPKRAAALSPPFILRNSAVALLGVLIAGQRLTFDTPLYAVGALAGAIIGSTIARRWMSERATRYVLAFILLFAGPRLFLR